MFDHLERVVDAVLSRSVAPMFGLRAAQGVVVLAYHDVIDAENFKRQLEFLVDNMSPIDPERLIRGIRGVEDLPPRAALITFDDGSRSLLERGVPLLQEFALSALAFVNPGFFDSELPFWWKEVDALFRRGARIPALGAATAKECIAAMKNIPDDERVRLIDELREMAPGPAIAEPQLRTSDLFDLRAAGIEIANHTLTHPCLDQCTADKLRVEITDAHDILTQVLGRPPRFFAYPNGNEDPRAEAVLESLGYRAAFLFDHRVTRLPTHPFRISRVRVNSTTSMDRFRTIVTGLHPFLHHAAGRS